MNTTKYIAASLLVTFVIACVGLFTPFGKESSTASVSPGGTTFATPKQAFIVFAPATGTATSTSILNTDTNDRVIKNVEYTCNGLGTSQTAYTGTGLANLVFTAGTTTTANPSSLPSTNILNTNVSTSTGFDYLSTSTPGVSSATPVTRIWTGGSTTYLTFVSNATSTGVCTIGVTYLPE